MVRTVCGGRKRRTTTCSTMVPMVPVAEGVGASKIFVFNLFIVVKVTLVQLQTLLSQANYLYANGTRTHHQSVTGMFNTVSVSIQLIASNSPSVLFIYNNCAKSFSTSLFQPLNENTQSMKRCSNRQCHRRSNRQCHRRSNRQ